MYKRQVFENVPLPVAESMIDYVFLTHAHVDHSGLLPLLYARGFRGQIYDGLLSLGVASKTPISCSVARHYL